MRVLLIIFTSVWTIFWVFIGAATFIDTHQQIKKDKTFTETKIKPSVDFNKRFEKADAEYAGINYSWKDSFILLTICYGLGLLPPFFVFFILNEDEK